MKVKILNHEYYDLANHFEDKIYDAINDVHSDLIKVNVGLENSLHGWLAFEREWLEVIEEKIVKMKVRLKHLMGYSIDNKIGDVVEAIFEENQYRCLCNWGGITGWLFFTNYAVELIEESDGLTWEKVKEDFESQYAITKSKAFKLDQHYNNENGSLYLFAQQHELNAWEFDILKRIVRCRKKGQFKEDLEKTKRVIDLYLKEFEA